MRENWEYGVLEDAVQKGSSNISLNKVKDDEGEYPLFSAKGFAKNISFFQQEKEYLGIIKDGAGIGRVSKHPAKSSIVATMQYLIPKDGFDIGFIEYFLNGIDFEKHRNGSTIPHIYFKDYKSERFPILRLPEQKRIVSILDRAFEAIDKVKTIAEQNLKNAKELFESYLQDVFENKGDDWEEKKLNEISDNLDSKRVPITKRDRKSGNIPYYGASGIVDYVEDYLFDEDLLCISEDGANLLARTYPIAFHISGKTWVNNHAHILRFSDMTTQQFVGLYLNSIKLDDFVSGMAQPKLNQSQLNKIPIPFPTIEEQKQIVQKLDVLSAETKKLEGIYQQKIDDLEELKKSILQKAFNGEL